MLDRFLGRLVQHRFAFAVRSEREGTHDFTSMDVARVVGQAVCDRFIARRGQRPPVNLDYPDLEVFSTLVEEHFLLGSNLTEGSLHRRPWRRSLAHLTALRPTLAAAVVMASGWDHRLLIDPMCGTGTLLIEGALWRRGLSPSLGREEGALPNCFLFTVANALTLPPPGGSRWYWLPIRRTGYAWQAIGTGAAISETVAEVERGVWGEPHCGY